LLKQAIPLGRLGEPEDLAGAVAFLATMAATLALVVVLIIALDYPFRGEISVTPDPFIMTQQSWSLDKK
jgi:hypothetical protein